MADSAYACTDETRKAAEQLRQITETVPAARDVAHGLSRRGGGDTSGKPGSRLPLDLGAMAKLDAVQAELTTWARATAEERIGHTLKHVGTDPILHAVGYLLANLEWWRHRAEVDEFLGDVEACARIVAGIARGPAPQRYLGPCGAAREHGGLCGRGKADPCFEDDFTAECDCWCHKGEPEICDGDIYAREGASNGACRLCGAQVSTDARRAWLDAEARSHAYTAAEIAAAYPIKANTIRQWLSRGLLVQHGELDGRPLLLLGDVLDLAAGDAARRETARAERARRKEASAA